MLAELREFNLANVRQYQEVLAVALVCAAPSLLAAEVLPLLEDYEHRHEGLASYVLITAQVSPDAYQEGDGGGFSASATAPAPPAPAPATPSSASPSSASPAPAPALNRAFLPPATPATAHQFDMKARAIFAVRTHSVLAALCQAAGQWRCADTRSAVAGRCLAAILPWAMSHNHNLRTFTQARGC